MIFLKDRVEDGLEEETAWAAGIEEETTKVDVSQNQRDRPREPDHHTKELGKALGGLGPLAKDWRICLTDQGLCLREAKDCSGGLFGDQCKGHAGHQRDESRRRVRQCRGGGSCGTNRGLSLLSCPDPWNLRLGCAS